MTIYAIECKPGERYWQTPVSEGILRKDRKEEVTGHKSGRFLESKRDRPRFAAKSAHIKGQSVSL